MLLGSQDDCCQGKWVSKYSFHLEEYSRNRRLYSRSYCFHCIQRGNLVLQVFFFFLNNTSGIFLIFGISGGACSWWKFSKGACQTKGYFCQSKRQSYCQEPLVSFIRFSNISCFNSFTNYFLSGSRNSEMIVMIMSAPSVIIYAFKSSLVTGN